MCLRGEQVASASTVPALCFAAEQAHLLEDGSWMEAELSSDEVPVGAALRALKSSHERVRGASCQALKSLALTMSPHDDGSVVAGRLTQVGGCLHARPCRDYWIIGVCV